MYCTRKVLDDLIWVGADDRRLVCFEGAYDVPNGVSYNSYLLTDEKTPVAVKIWQIELLDDLRTRIGWIEENLTEMVRSLSENPECRPAMAAYARRYLRRVTAGRAGGKRNG